MPRFKLLIEYAGTRYSGWQIQKNARTVQGEIDRAVREVVEAARVRAVWLGTHRRRRPCTRAGRAPRAVHRPPARIAAAETERRASVRHPHPRDRHGAAPLSRAARCRRALLSLSDFAPPDGVRQSRSSGGFANRSTSARCATAATAFVGMKDFQAFTDDDPEEKSTRVLVDSVEIVEIGRADPGSRAGLALPLEDGAANGRRARGRRTRGSEAVRCRAAPARGRQRHDASRRWPRRRPDCFSKPCSTKVTRRQDRSGRADVETEDCERRSSQRRNGANADERRNRIMLFFVIVSVYFVPSL